MKGSGCYNCQVKGCTANYRGSRCAHLRDLSGVGTDPKTNGDSLRGMNDEELADQLVINVDGIAQCRMYLSAPIGRMFVSRRDAVRETINWIREPAEED